MQMDSRHVVPAAMPLRGTFTYTEQQAQTCEELLARFRPGIMAADSALLHFAGVNGRDVYNITAPFTIDGMQLIAGRVEDRTSELSDIVFFRRAESAWVPHYAPEMLRGLQDPCVCFIGGELIVGGVRYPVHFENGRIGWRTEFYRGASLHALRPMLQGPAGMKDIRFCGLPEGRVAVFSRPQGAKGGRGKIGFTVADSLEAITAEMIQEAPLLPGQFALGEWGGANEVHVLSDGRLGVLGHIARWDVNGCRHYFPMAFKVDPETGSASSLRIIARRSVFPDGPFKRADLADVVFTGGLVRHTDGTATMYAGLSDAAAGMVRLPDPFEAPRRIPLV